MSLSLAFKPSRPLHAFSREAAISLALGIGCAAAIAGVSGATPVADHSTKGLTSTVVMPVAPPMIVRNVDPEEAVRLNAQIPLAKVDVIPASPFIFGKASSADRERALECLTSAIYYEAAQESEDGQRGVAQVVLNRVRHPAFPATVCGVVYEGSTRATGCQFTFTCDGSMIRAPMPALWNRARKIAAEALAGRVFAPVGNATHYHANYVVPYWASSLVKTHVQGAHIFYRWAGGWGQPAAFNEKWRGREADPATLRLAALTAPHITGSAEKSDTGATKLAEAEAKIVEDAGRVRVSFTPEARNAVEKAAVEARPYVEKVHASDNLRYVLGGEDSHEPTPALASKAGIAD